MSKVVSSSKTIGAALAEPGSIMGFVDGPQVYSSITTQKNVYIANTAITIPANVTSVSFKLWGAGGGGGANNLNAKPGGGGGFAEYLDNPVSGAIYYISVGATSGGGPGGSEASPIPAYYGGSGGGMSMVHLKSGANYIVKAVAGGGGGGGGSNGGIAGFGGGGGANGTAGGGVAGGAAGGNGTGGAGGDPSSPIFDGTNFTNIVVTVPPIGVGGGGGTGASGTIFNSQVGGGGGGAGYGGGGGGSTQAGGGGGGNYSANGTTVAGSNITPGANSDPDYPPGVGVGGTWPFTAVGFAGAVVVTYSVSTQRVSIPAETVPIKASSFIVSAANNLQAGTSGDGGDLELNAGTTAATAPAVAGSVLVSGVKLAPASDNAVALGGPTNRWSTVYAATATINTSDKREKDDIVPLPLGLDFVNQLNPVQYRLRDGIRPHYGFLAQDIKDVLDARQIDFGGYVRAEKYSRDPATGENVSDGYVLGLRYEEFIAPLTKAVQELAVESDANRVRLIEFSKEVARREEIDELKTHVSQLESLVASLQSQLEKIETPP